MVSVLLKQHALTQSTHQNQIYLLVVGTIQTNMLWENLPLLDYTMGSQNTMGTFFSTYQLLVTSGRPKVRSELIVALQLDMKSYGIFVRATKTIHYTMHL